MAFGKAQAAATGLGLFSKGVSAGFVGLFTPVRSMQRSARNIGTLARGTMKGNYKYAGYKSMQMLGAAAGATYATRLIRGKGLFRDRRGKKDRIPFVPFL